jgi:iron complex outermembrane receptor protein
MPMASTPCWRPIVRSLIALASMPNSRSISVWTNTLDWGLWYERSRQLEYIDAQYVDPNTGVPQAIWGDNHVLTYSNGLPWENYSEYDLTTVKKVFVEDSWTPTDAWTLNAGVAYLYTERVNQFVLYPNNPDPVDWTSSQNSDERYHNFLPTLGASWRPNENNQIYYSITRTFRAPQDSSTYGNSSTRPAATAAGKRMVERIGLAFYDGPLTLHTDAYLANMGNRTAVGLDQDTYINYYINAGPVRMAGLNAEGNLDLGHGLSLYSSYTYTQSKVKQDLYLPATEDTAAEFYNTAGQAVPRYAAQHDLPWRTLFAEWIDVEPQRQVHRQRIRRFHEHRTRAFELHLERQRQLRTARLQRVA